MSAFPATNLIRRWVLPLRILPKIYSLLAYSES
jgi:hypothetical protein